MGVFNVRLTSTSQISFTLVSLNLSKRRMNKNFKNMRQKSSYCLRYVDRQSLQITKTIALEDATNTGDKISTDFQSKGIKSKSPV